MLNVFPWKYMKAINQPVVLGRPQPNVADILTYFVRDQRVAEHLPTYECTS